jgi:hypothetical protein
MATERRQLCYFYILSGFPRFGTIHLIIQRKRHPVDDPQLDEQAVGNFKVGLKGMGIVFAFITFGFLIAIGLAAILK